MATARIYPNKLSDEHELVELAAGQTIEQWLRSQAPNYRPMAHPPLSIRIAGELVPASAWACHVIQPGDELTVTAEPGGFDPVTWSIIAVVTAIASAGMAIYMASQIQDNYQNTTPRGSSIYDVNAQGNRPRMMGVIPEHFGTHKAFPDLKAEPHYYYVNNERWLNMLLSQGVGSFDHPTDELYIGNTPIGDYGSDINLLIAEPGQSIAGHPAHRCMYSSPEIGGTSAGTGQQLAGFLNVASANDGGLHVTLASNVISMTRDYEYWDGANPVTKPFTPPWPVGHHIAMTGTSASSVLFAGNVDLVDMGDDGLGTDYPDEIRNPYGWSALSVGQGVRLLGAGDDSGDYTVRSISGTAMTLNDGYGAPVTWLTPATGVYVTIVEAWSNDGTYRIESVSTGHMTLTMVDPSTLEDIPGWTYFVGSDAGGTIKLQAEAVTLAVVEQDLTGDLIGPIRANPIAHAGTYYEIDLRMPRGCGYLNNDGNFDQRSVTIRIEYRAAGSSDAWQYVDYTFTGATNDELADTVPLTLAEGAYEFRLHNLTATSDDTKLLDRVEWVGLKTLIAAPTSYADETIICLSIRGSDTLSAASENKISTVWTRKLPVPDGAGGWTSELQATNDIAPAMRYIIHDVGHTDLQIGMDDLLALHDVWSARGDTFAARFDSDSTMLESIKRVLQVGYAEPTLDHGQITQVRRGIRSAASQMYQPQNLIDPGVEVDAVMFDPDEPDGVEVEYFSSDTWKSETVLCVLPGEYAINPEKLRAFGVTSRTQAWRLGMRRRRQIRYRRLTASCKTEMDGFNSRYMEMVAVGVDYPGLTQTGRLTSASGLLVTTDQPITTAPGLTASLLVRRQDGSASGPYTATVLDAHTLQLDRALDFTAECDGPLEPPLYQLGQWLSCWVEDIRPSGTDQVALSLSVYDEREFDDDDRYPSADRLPASLANPA